MVKTHLLEDKIVRLNVRQGKVKGLEEENKPIKLHQDGKDLYIAEAKIGDYCNKKDITNKDDFKDYAIFKVILGSKDSKKLKTYKENLEKLKDKKTTLFLVIDAHSKNGITVVYNGRNPDKDGEPDDRTTPNYWLDMDDKWFEITKNQRAPWMEIALEEAKKAKGCKESKEPMYSTAKSYLRFVGNKYEPTDSINGPWCAAFMNWCMNESGHKYAKSASSLAPIHEKFKSKFKKIDKPIYGCILVYKHTSKWKGHTGFLYGKTKSGKYILLGGNQDNTIKLDDYGEYTSKSKKKKLYGFYIPIDYKVKQDDYLTVKDENLSLKKENKRLGVSTSKSSGKTT